ISCTLLAADTEKDRVSMLVRLAPGVAYPPHRHAGVEELYLLHGELMIDDKKLYPGDYNRGSPARPISVSGARPAARAFSSPPPETCFAEGRRLRRELQSAKAWRDASSRRPSFL